MAEPTEQRTIHTVIRFLGAAAMALVVGEVLLVADALHSGHDVSPAAVALIGGVSTLAGTVIGSLGSLLVSTRPGAAAGDPTTFTAPPTSTVTVEPSEPTPADAPARTRRSRT